MTGAAPARPRGRGTVGRVVKGILALQLAMAAVLFARDMTEDGVPAFPFERRAPGLDAPVSPGDQTRRYRPGRPAQPPAGPGRVFPASDDMPSRLRFEPGASTLALTGRIATGDAERFADFLDGREAPLERVVLDSPGGSVADALAIGRRLRETGATTEMEAGAICLSACPYILIGGAERRVDAEAVVGVHQHYFGESSLLPAFLAVEDVQRGQGEVLAYLDEMGVDPLLMRHALTTPPDEIYVLVPAELAGYRVATDIPGRP